MQRPMTKSQLVAAIAESATLAELAWSEIPNARLVEVLQARSRQLAHELADPEKAARMAQFDSWPDAAPPPDVDVRTAAAPGPHGEVDAGGRLRE